MKPVVTGGSGFTGERVLSRFARLDKPASAVCRSDRAQSVVERFGASPIEGDLDDPSSLQRAFAESGADTLVNIASLGFGHAPTIIEAAEHAGIKRAVFISTTAIFTKLNAPSKAVRVAAEDAIAASSLNATIIRPTMIYGAPGDRNLERLVRLLRRTPVVPIPGRGAHLQQPVHVDDLADTIVAAALIDRLPRLAYDVAGPDPITFRRIIDEIAAALDRRVRVVPIPLGPVRTGLGLYERISSNPRLRVEQLDRLEEDKSFDIDDARRDLGHAPRSFADGIAEEVRLLNEVSP